MLVSCCCRGVFAFCFIHINLCLKDNNSPQTVLETQHFYFLHSVVIQHDTKACSAHRKFPKTPKLLLKTNQFIRQRQQQLIHCLFLVMS